MNTLRVLHVDDRPDFGEIVVQFLEREDDRFEVHTEPSAKAGLDHLKTADIDCIVSDYDMPGQDGLDFLDAVRAEYPDIPFILFTGKGSEEIASDAISRGVTDYLQKGSGTNQYTVLANRIVNVVEQYRSGEALKEREESLARAQRIANLGNWDWDVDTGELYWSDQIYRIFRVEPRAFDPTYEAFLDFVHPDDRGDVRNAVDAALDGAESYDIEHRIICSDGTERIVHEQAAVIRDDAGDPTAMSGTVHDITEQVERRRELRRYETIVETTEQGVYVFDADGRIEFVNRRVVDGTDVSRAAVTDEHVSTMAERDVLTEEATERIEDAVAALAQNGASERRISVTRPDPDHDRTLELRLTAVQTASQTTRIFGFSRTHTD